MTRIPNFFIPEGASASVSIHVDKRTARETLRELATIVKEANSRGLVFQVSRHRYDPDGDATHVTKDDIVSVTVYERGAGAKMSFSRQVGIGASTWDPDGPAMQSEYAYAAKEALAIIESALKATP